MQSSTTYLRSILNNIMFLFNSRYCIFKSQPRAAIVPGWCTRTHTPTHRRPGCRCSMGRCAPNHDKVNAPFLHVPLAMNGRSVLYSNKQSHMRRSIRDMLGCFPSIIFFRPNSWQDVLSVIPKIYRHLPRRSSKNCDMQFANTDRKGKLY